MGFQRKQSVNYIPQADLPLAIREAERIIELYKTRDPFEIIDCRKTKLRFTDRFFNLLGYFVVKHKQAYIGINANPTLPRNQKSRIKKSKEIQRFSLLF